MKKAEFVSHMAAGAFEIEETEGCSCVFEWEVRKHRYDDTELFCDIDGNECWTGKALKVAGKVVYEDTDMQPYNYLEDGKIQDLIEAYEDSESEEDNAFAQILSDAVDECQVSSTKFNQTHYNRLEISLAEFIKDEGYRCFVEYP